MSPDAQKIDEEEKEAKAKEAEKETVIDSFLGEASGLIRLAMSALDGSLAQRKKTTETARRVAADCDTKDQK